MKENTYQQAVSLPGGNMRQGEIDHSVGPFCLIFDADEWFGEQDSRVYLSPPRYALVTCIPQQNGSLHFSAC